LPTHTNDVVVNKILALEGARMFSGLQICRNKKITVSVMMVRTFND